MSKLVEKSNEPGLTQKQICNQLGFPDSTIKRYKYDIIMNIPYKRKKTGRKTINQILQ